MLISLNWLKQYVDLKEDVLELEKALTMIGQEVENIEEQGKHLEHVVIGKIIDYQKHPNSDKLTLLQVDIGEETLQIVCGAFKDRKSTRLNSSHANISYAVFCLKKKQSKRQNTSYT